MISIAQEMAKLPDDFRYFDFHDDRIEAEFRKQVRLAAKHNWRKMYHKGHFIIEYVPHVGNLREGMKDYAENTIVMAALDIVTNQGFVRWRY